MTHRDANGIGIYIRAVDGTCGAQVATVLTETLLSDDDSQAVADAELFAAAPELLKACKDVLRHPHIRAFLPYDPSDETFVALAAAIRKAEGKRAL